MFKGCLLSRIPRDLLAATANSHKVCSDVIDNSQDTQVCQLKKREEKDKQTTTPLC